MEASLECSVRTSIVIKSIQILVFSFLFTGSVSMGCDCRDINYDDAFERDYKQSELIFLGEITKVSSGIVFIKVVEIFKGNFRHTFKIDLERACTPAMSSGETWLIYANKESERITVSECSLSRSFNHSLKSFLVDLKLPPPPAPGQEVNKMDKLNGLSIENSSSLVLRNEINVLRTRKMQLALEASRQEVKFYKRICTITSAVVLLLILLAFFRKVK
ncbi:hypothetical protein [Pararcticibacter amylolyticus]|uniref:Uncharacterized protein n=1 Tax=Pararcticibacter amylolyticus TaxID=2173175 RepID=A0A2U2PC78_9SPHI|nr:hypothetical protein [Pararcticibacter amylolyticus]PWG78982.1 hypothetical protein DDR33_19220 [Pararcticibacter amylolyticus]